MKKLSSIKFINQISQIALLELDGSVVDLWKQDLDNPTNSLSIDEYANGYISHFHISK